MKYPRLDMGTMEAVTNMLGGMQGIEDLLSGKIILVRKQHVIDLDADPRIPYDGWKVEEHKKGGKFTWDSTKVCLYLNKDQQGGKSVEGNKLRKELVEKLPYNANLLDYLLDNPHLIPEDWKGKAVYFWGTIYRNSDGYLCVRCLYFYGGRWQQDDRWLGYDFDSNYPSAVPAS